VTTKHYELRIDSDHVLVTYGAGFAATSVEDQRALFAAIDDLLRVSNVRKVVVDTRALPTMVTGAARDVCWDWAIGRTNHDDVALIASSEMVRVQGNMTARARRAHVGSFATLDEALRWLRTPLRLRR
jgi:hypothetical protein